MKKENGKKFDGRSRIPTEAYKNGWNEIYLNRVLKNAVLDFAFKMHGKYPTKQKGFFSRRQVKVLC